MQVEADQEEAEDNVEDREDLAAPLQADAEAAILVHCTQNYSVSVNKAWIGTGMQGHTWYDKTDVNMCSAFSLIIRAPIECVGPYLKTQWDVEGGGRPFLQIFEVL